MGYSLSVFFNTSSERDRMLAFLQQQDWTDFDRATQDSQRSVLWQSPLEPLAGECLAHPPALPPAHLMGFNGALIPPGAWMVCRWAAAQASQDAPAVYLDEMQVSFLNPASAKGGPVDGRGIPLPRPSGLRRLLNSVGLRWVLGGGSGSMGLATEQEVSWLRALDHRWATFQLQSGGTQV